MSDRDEAKLLLYYRTRKQIKAYLEVPVEQKLSWLQMQMEFFHECMPDKAKRFRDRFNSGKTFKTR